MFYCVLHLVMREYKISHEERNQIKYRLVEIQQPADSCGVWILDKGLMSDPKQNTHQDDRNDTCFRAEFKELAFSIQLSDKQ